MTGKAFSTQEALDKWDGNDFISLGTTVWQAHRAVAGWWPWWAGLLSPVLIAYPQGSSTALISLPRLGQLACILPPPGSYH